MNIQIFVKFFSFPAILIILAFGGCFTFSQASSGGQFMRHGLGAKAAGYGNAYTAIVDDASAVYWNPAGLAHINGDRKAGKSIDKEAGDVFENSDFDELLKQSGEEVEPSATVKKAKALPKPYRFESQWFFSYSYLVDNKHTAFGAAAMSLPKGSMGVGVYSSYIPGISTYDASGNFIDKRLYQSYAAYFGYAFSAGFTRIGFSVNGIGEGEKKAWVGGGGLNVGVQSTPIPIITLGADISNLIGMMQQSVGSSKKWKKLDTLLRVSLSINSLPPNSNFRFVIGVTSNLDNLKKEGIRFNLGMSYKVVKFLTFFLGFNHGTFSFGTEFNFSGVTFAYTISQEKSGKGLQHAADFGFRF